MAYFSCTNQRYEYTPLHLEEINILPIGTLLFRGVNREEPFNPSSNENSGRVDGNTNLFSQVIDVYPHGTLIETYMVVQELPYIIGIPEDKGLEGLCWEYHPNEDFCFDDNLDVEIPHPMAWSQEPYFYLCDFNKLDYLKTGTI